MSLNDLLVDNVKLGRPAHWALANAGIVTIADLAQWTQRDVAALHGIGPKAFPALTAALAERGLAFRPS